MKKTALKIFAAISLLFLADGFLMAQEGGNTTFSGAVQNYLMGDISKAKAGFEKAVKENPGDDAAWYYLGLCAIAEKDSQSAREYMNRAVSIDSTNYWYREALLGTYSPREDIDLTIAQYEKLLRDFPKKTDRQYALVNLYISAGNLDKAIVLLDEIEGRDGKNDGTVMARSGILRNQNKIEESYQVLKDYVSEYSSPYILTILGEYEMGMYNDSTALAYFNEALSLEDAYLPAKIGKAETYRLTRKYQQYFDILKSIVADVDEAPAAKADYLTQVVRSTDARFVNSFKTQLDTVFTLMTDTHPSDTTALQTACAYNVYVGETDKAAALALKLCELYPQKADFAYTYFQILYRGEDWDAISRAYKEFEPKFPDDALLIDFDAVAKYNKKDYRGVLEASMRQLELAAGDSAKTLHALSSIGDMYHELGNNKESYKAYEKALKINPNYAPVLNNYAWYLCQEGKQLKKAVKMSRKTIEQEPKNATYLDTYAWILHLTGNTLEAKLFLKQAMLYGGKENATIMKHYIVVLETLGEKDMANFYRGQLKSLPKGEGDE